jgi:hypothetical protein
MLRAGDCRRRPRTPWSSKCAGQVYVVGAGGVEPPSSSVSANYRNRCAAARFPRSRSTVGAEVKCSHSVQLNALLTRSSFTDTAPIIATSCSTPCLLHRALPAQTHSHILPRHPTYTLISTPAPTQPRTPHLSVVPLPSTRTIQIQHTTAMHQGALAHRRRGGSSDCSRQRAASVADRTQNRSRWSPLTVFIRPPLVICWQIAGKRRSGALGA